MGEKIKQWLHKPLYVYLLGLFFLVYRTMQFPEAFQADLFIEILFGYWLAIFSLKYFLKIKLKFRYVNYWLLVSMVFILFFQEIFSAVSFFLQLRNLRIRYLTTIFFGIVLVIFYSKKILFANKNFNTYLSLFFLFFIITNIAFGYYNFTNAKLLFNINSNKLVHLKKTDKPNDIIWILLDEYASTPYLKKQLNYTNNFGDSLRSRGFYVCDSMPSRSDLTLYSVNSLFNIDDSIKYPNYALAQDELKKNLWCKLLKEQQYVFINCDFLDFPTSSKVNAAFATPFPKTYCNQIFYNSLIPILITTFSNTELKIDSYNNNVFDKSIKAINTKENELRFFWVHLLLPHSPFLRDSLGNQLKNIDNIKALTDEEVRTQYYSYLAYGNKQTLAMLSQIQNWKQKTIIISGDHGFRQLLKSGDSYRKATFAAIYYPNMDTLELKHIRYLQQIPLYLRY